MHSSSTETEWMLRYGHASVNPIPPLRESSIGLVEKDEGHLFGINQINLYCLLRTPAQRLMERGLLGGESE